MTQLERDLDKARKQLAALEKDLPGRHALLADSETDAQHLRDERADLDKQARAKGRVEVARDILAQHEADIQTAQTEVKRLEQATEREAALAEMTRQAERAAQHKAELDAHLTTAGKALEDHVQRCIEAHDGLREARQAFEAVGADDDLKRELQERGLRLAEGPDPFKPYRFPEPHGGIVWGLAYQELVKRAEAQRRERLEQEAEARRKRKELERPPEVKLAGLCVDHRDTAAAANRLGDLVQGVSYIDKGMVGESNKTVFSILPDDLEQAQELLKGALTFADATATRPGRAEKEGTPA